MLQVDLGSAKSPEQAAELVRAFGNTHSLPSGHPVVGYNWDQENWPNGAFPHRSALDKIEPSRSVILYRKDFHAAWINTYALKAANCGRPDRIRREEKFCVMLRAADGSADR